MKKLAIALAGAVAAIGFAMPAAAHDNNWNSRHDRQHDRLEQRHDDVHDQLEDEHEDAHAWGLSSREHRRLHRALQYQHDRADHQLEHQHSREHRRDYWYGYNRY